MDEKRRFAEFCRVACARLGPRFLTDRDSRARRAEDRSGLEGQLPGAVVELVERRDAIIVAELAEYYRVGIVPRGSGTGKAGGAIPGALEVAVDFSGFDRILAWHPDDLYAVIQPGVTAFELDRQASRHGLMYPPDPASSEQATLGGNIATNAGGPRALKYGVTGRYIWGVELVLAGGRVVRTGRRSLKGVTGLDITSLIVGSEGTLGIITEATIHVIPRPECVEGAWLGFDTEFDAVCWASGLFRAGILPRSLELIDREALAALGADHALPLNSPVAIHIELDGGAASVRTQLDRVIALDRDVPQFCAGSAVERERLRTLRRAISEALRAKFPRKLSDDIAVPRSAMSTFLKRAQQLAGAHGVRIAAYGHLGDGNLHLNRLAVDDRERKRAEILREPLLTLTLELGGTLSAEHGIGLTKRDELTKEQSTELIALQHGIKRVFDPHGIMNPGKVLPSV